MKKKTRFSICIDERKEPFIAVDLDFITDCIFQDKNGSWVGGMMLCLDKKITVISLFKNWRKAKSFVIDNKENGFYKEFSDKEVTLMKKAIMERDKRIKFS